MKAHIFATILARDGKKLYDSLARFGLNLTDMGAEQLVYGEINLSDIGEVVQICSDFGDSKIEITRK